ncbi:MAG: electron transfer flavoprotein subunit beta/FixA family protein [Planctomycetes bacterium]|nr:electron transfer flavoprotein subunit beta/FixA family protein [Planctomycetota bacterium]
MDSVVCVKRVPDTETKVQVGPDGRRIQASGVNHVLNPYDEYAVEACLQAREKAGSGEVTVLSLGPAEAAQTIRQALAMGADRGVLLKTDPACDYYMDPLSVAHALAARLKTMRLDLLWFGKLAIDDQSYAVGPAVATLLGLPCVTEVAEFAALPGRATATRVVEGDRVRMEVDLPAVFCASKGLNEPRFASLKGIMSAKKKPLETVDLAQGTARVEVVALELPPARQAGRWIGKGVEAVPELVRRLREEAKVL